MMRPRVWAKNPAEAMSHTTVISVEDEQEFSPSTPSNGKVNFVFV